MEDQVDPTKPLEEEPAEKKRKVQNLKSDGTCPNCQGSGLDGDPSGKNKRCEICQGTGKGSLPEGEYKTGTILLIKDKGTFIVNDYGELVPHAL